MARRPSLHHINALDIDPLSFIGMAAIAGANQISIFTHSPDNALPGRKAPVGFPLFLPTMEHDARACLSDNRVEVVSMEFFPIAANVPAQTYERALSTGRALGARRAVTHVHDTDTARAVDRLGELCDLAASMDVTLGLEFMGLTPGCNSIQSAAWFIDQVGRTNIGIGLDPLHFVRTGGKPVEISALEARYFAYAQLCDGHGTHRADNYITDALDRSLPGDGDFPLAEIFQALPHATPLEIEAPSERRTMDRAETQRFLTAIVKRCQEFVDLADSDRQDG